MDKDEKDKLLYICNELAKNEIDTPKVKKLLDEVNIPYSDDPYELSNLVLKRLHPPL